MPGRQEAVWRCRTSMGQHIQPWLPAGLRSPFHHPSGALSLTAQQQPPPHSQEAVEAAGQHHLHHAVTGDDGSKLHGSAAHKVHCPPHAARWRPQRELKPTAGPAELGGRRKLAGFRRAGAAGGSSTQLASSGPLPASYAGWLFAKAPHSAPPSPCSVRRVCPPQSTAHHHPCAPCSHFPDLRGVCRPLGGALRLGEEVQHRSLTHTHDRGSTPGSEGFDESDVERSQLNDGDNGAHIPAPPARDAHSVAAAAAGAMVAAWCCPLPGATVQYSRGVPKVG